jgi:hypothetical protein
MPSFGSHRCSGGYAERPGLKLISLRSKLRESLKLSADEPEPECVGSARGPVPGATRQLTYCFLRLANLDSGVFERLNRYEARLWRQMAQTLIARHLSGTFDQTSYS